MKIAISIPALFSGKKGGAENIAVSQANRLVQEGHSVILIYLKHKNAKLSYEIHNSIKLVELTDKNCYAKIATVVRKVKELAPDFFFFFYSDEDIVWQYLLGKLLRIPMGAQECTNPHRCIANIAKDSKITIEEAFIIRNTIAFSLGGIRVLSKRYKETFPLHTRKNIFAFKNTFPQIRPDMSKKKEQIILNINGASNKKNKNGIALLKAFSLIAKDLPDWRVLFIGNLSNQRALEEYCIEKGILAQTIFIDSTDDLNYFYSRASIHVICSYEEGCPNVVSETMLHSVPSIGFADCDGTKDLITHEKTGLLVERSECEESLAVAIKRLATDEQERGLFGANAFEQASINFDVDSINLQWDKLFKHIYDGNYFIEHSKMLQHYHYVLNSIILKKYDFIIPDDKFQPSVDFIIPLYNKREHIVNTIKSILNIKYSNFYIYIIDDCSTDGSYELVQSRYSKHKQIKIIKREKNGGLSVARNTGLEHATADFIQFWDADDLYTQKALSQLVYAAVVGFSDIVTGLAKRNDKILSAYTFTGITQYAIKQPYCFTAFQTMSTCFKLYRREFLERNNLRFIDGLYMQDTEFNLRAFSCASSVSMCDVVIGEYTDNAMPGEQRGSSVISDKRIESAFDICERYLKSHNNRIPKYYAEYIIIKFVIRFFITKIIDTYSYDIKSKEYLDKFIHYLQKMPDGIKYHFKTFHKNDFRTGILFAYLVDNNIEDALKVLKIEKQSKEWLIYTWMKISNQYNINYKNCYNRLLLFSEECKKDIIVKKEEINMVTNTNNTAIEDEYLDSLVAKRAQIELLFLMQNGELPSQTHEHFVSEDSSLIKSSDKLNKKEIKMLSTINLYGHIAKQLAQPNTTEKILKCTVSKFNNYRLLNNQVNPNNQVTIVSKSSLETFQRKYRKFRSNPYLFFENSKYPLVRYFSKFYKR